MILAHQITIRPNATQEKALGRACGVARHVWNWGINQKNEALKARKAASAAGIPKNLWPKVPNHMDLHRKLVILKHKTLEEGGLPWLKEVSKCAAQMALQDLDKAYDRTFRRIKKGETPGFPKFKSRNRDPGHFGLSQNLTIKDNSIHLARIGYVKIMPGNRGYLPDGLYSTARITEDHDRWVITTFIEIPETPQNPNDSRPEVGLDVGVRDLCYLSDHTTIPNPKALERETKRLRKAKLAIARKQRAADNRLGARKKGEYREESKRLKRARRRSAKVAYRVACIRKDALHKATTFLAKTYKTIVIEDLHGKSMTKARKGKGRAAKAGLNRAILDSGMLRIRPLLTYKMQLHGGTLRVVPAPYTSRTCSKCGKQNNPKSSKVYKCEHCGVVLDRDYNASLNILAKAKAAAGLAVVPSQVDRLWAELEKESRGVDVRPQISDNKNSEAIYNDPTVKAERL